MQVHIVLRSGSYVSTVNGVECSAERTEVLGVFTSEEKAKFVLRNTPAPGWNCCATWVETAHIDAWTER